MINIKIFINELCKYLTMIGYCIGCKKNIRGTKKDFSILWFIITGFIGYGLYRLVFIRKNKCRICGMKLKRLKIDK